MRQLNVSITSSIGVARHCPIYEEATGGLIKLHSFLEEVSVV
jgi:hypothetical protein